jgi:GH15 family glucan-1,4-alpha-glucosidase
VDDGAGLVGCTVTARYAPIGEYGVVGDLYTVALVGMDGSIDFLCLPHFDSPSVFAAQLDAERGGRFQVAPFLAAAARKQLYLPDTNVLLTQPRRSRAMSGRSRSSRFTVASESAPTSRAVGTTTLGS